MIKTYLAWSVAVGVVLTIATGLLGVTGLARTGIAVAGGAIAWGIAYRGLQARREAKAGGGRWTRRDMNIVYITAAVYIVAAGAASYGVTTAVIRWAGDDLSTVAALGVVPVVMLAVVLGCGWFAVPRLARWVLRRWGSR